MKASDLVLGLAPSNMCPFEVQGPDTSPEFPLGLCLGVLCEAT